VTAITETKGSQFGSHAFGDGTLLSRVLYLPEFGFDYVQDPRLVARLSYWLAHRAVIFSDAKFIEASFLLTFRD
jgi:hypothetical protein